ncbi:phage head morphogenesis protein [Sulfidibacter corallicola]|uniref:Minor capsid protein n=1 Tax=Sulfidibacter corallicola TaxID=2818388 RepID=A0A8A4TLA9_SULCO|nr:minor capsid protein [Sulfidibacter corallicola]QTD49648.1 minor capsid protein [Sulfidibacter corallicola]
MSELVALLEATQKDVHRIMLRAKTQNMVENDKRAKTHGLQTLEKEISAIVGDLRANSSLLFRRTIREAFKNGIRGGAQTLMAASLPYFKDLAPRGLNKLTTSVFQVIDRDALDFLAKYTVRLSGDVSRELRDGIKRTLLTGIVRGLSSEQIAKEMGQVIPDLESFRNAGGRVFSKAQYRLELIARTETLRAHNQGRVTFYQQVGVEKVEWLTLDDERVCPVCGPLNGQVFPIDQPLDQPRHPNCRCTHVPAGDFEVAEPGRKQKGGLKPPDEINRLAKVKATKRRERTRAFNSGDPAQLKALPSGQLAQLSIDEGLSLWRSKSELVAQLNRQNPAVDHSRLDGAALQATLRAANIGRRRDRSELLAQLKRAQAEMIALREKAEALTLSDLTVAELRELAKAYSVPVTVTRKDVIDIATDRYPKRDWTEVAGAELAALRRKMGLSTVKTKDQLIRAIEDRLGARLAKKAINRPTLRK